MTHYSIGEFAKKTGLSISKLRYYEQEKLIYSHREKIIEDIIKNLISHGLNLLSNLKNGAVNKKYARICEIKIPR